MPRLAILEGYSDYYRKGTKYRLTKKRRVQTNKFARAARKCRGKTKGKFKVCMRKALKKKGRKSSRRR